MSENGIRTMSLRLPVEMHRQVAQYAKANDLSMAQAVRRFIQEVRIATRLRHPGSAVSSP